MVKIEINEDTTIFSNNICAVNICQRVKSINKMTSTYYAQFKMNDGRTYNSREFATETELKQWLNNVSD